MTSPELPKIVAKSERLSRTLKQLENSGTPAKETAVLGQPNPEMPLKEEIDGPDGPDPTRFGDWERNGRCIDF